MRLPYTHSPSNFLLFGRINSPLPVNSLTRMPFTSAIIECRPFPTSPISKSFTFSITENRYLFGTEVRLN